MVWGGGCIEARKTESDGGVLGEGTASLLHTSYVMGPGSAACKLSSGVSTQQNFNLVHFSQTVWHSGDCKISID